MQKIMALIDEFLVKRGRLFVSEKFNLLPAKQ